MLMGKNLFCLLVLAIELLNIIFNIILLIYASPVSNVECNEMSPLHSSRLESLHISHGPTSSKHDAHQKHSTYFIFIVLNLDCNDFACRKKKCARRVHFSFGPRRRDKLRRKRLLLLLLCIISFVRWPTVEMSCNYSHSYFRPSLFSVAIVTLFSILFLKTKNKHSDCEMAGTL